MNYNTKTLFKSYIFESMKESRTYTPGKIEGLYPHRKYVSYGNGLNMNQYVSFRTSGETVERFGRIDLPLYDPNLPGFDVVDIHFTPKTYRSYASTHPQSTLPEERYQLVKSLLVGGLSLAEDLKNDKFPIQDLQQLDCYFLAVSLFPLFPSLLRQRLGFTGKPGDNLAWIKKVF